jgi:hypothetical protein
MELKSSKKRLEMLSTRQQARKSEVQNPNKKNVKKTGFFERDFLLKRLKTGLVLFI